MSCCSANTKKTLAVKGQTTSRSHQTAGAASAKKAQEFKNGANKSGHYHSCGHHSCGHKSGATPVANSERERERERELDRRSQPSQICGECGCSTQGRALRTRAQGRAFRRTSSQTHINSPNRTRSPS